MNTNKFDFNVILRCVFVHTVVQIAQHRVNYVIDCVNSYLTIQIN